MRILLDTDVVLDVLLERQPFVEDARRIWSAADEGVFEACIAAFSIPTIHYVCERQAGTDAANLAVDHCAAAFEVCPLYRECILAARAMRSGDFEDNLQVACAITDFAQGIVTRNAAHFAGCPLRVYSPAELLKALHR